MYCKLSRATNFGKLRHRNASGVWVLALQAHVQSLGQSSFVGCSSNCHPDLQNLALAFLRSGKLPATYGRGSGTLQNGLLLFELSLDSDHFDFNLPTKSFGTS